MARCSAKTIAVGCALVLLAAATGCGQQEWGYLDGIVRLNGEPVGPGSLSLKPIHEDRAGAVAIIGDDGTYSVMSSGRKEGARVGEYRVMAFNSQDFKPANGKIPPKYSNPATSDLTVTIEPGHQTKDFELSQ